MSPSRRRRASSTPRASPAADRHVPMPADNLLHRGSRSLSINENPRGTEEAANGTPELIGSIGSRSERPVRRGTRAAPRPRGTGSRIHSVRTAPTVPSSVWSISAIGRPRAARRFGARLRSGSSCPPPSEKSERVRHPRERPGGATGRSTLRWTRGVSAGPSRTGASLRSTRSRRASPLVGEDRCARPASSDSADWPVIGAAEIRAFEPGSEHLLRRIRPPGPPRSRAPRPTASLPSETRSARPTATAAGPAGPDVFARRVPGEPLDQAHPAPLAGAPIATRSTGHVLSRHDYPVRTSVKQPNDQRGLGPSGGRPDRKA